jgi:cytochrome c biogenesis protein CcmG/thiol:disulfide interchange protein DsbE
MTAIASAPQGVPPRRRPRTARWVAAAVGVVLVLLVVVLATRDPATNRLADSPLLGRPAPALAGSSLLDGEEFDVADERGRFVLVNFFATWCEPCRKEHPELLRFAQDHRVADDARVVSVVFDDEPEDVERYFRDNGGDWPVLGDGDGRAIVDWSVSGVPESYLVGPNGAVRAKIVGGVDADQLDAVVRRVGSGGTP